MTTRRVNSVEKRKPDPVELNRFRGFMDRLNDEYPNGSMAPDKVNRTLELMLEGQIIDNVCCRPVTPLEEIDR